MPSEVHIWNGEQAHVGQWRGLEGVAVIAAPQNTPLLTPNFIQHCCEWLTTSGFASVVTPALTPSEIVPYLQADFSAREHLHVLIHRLGALPQIKIHEKVAIRRAEANDIPTVLQLDHTAFDQFWRFDRDALIEACTATPQSSFRVAVASKPFRFPAPRWESDNTQRKTIPEGTILGYCITGRNRQQGFLQRLAVVPSAQGKQIGTSLVRDCLEWLVRRRSKSCVVNTQESNLRARTLYQTCGFEMLHSGLYVMSRSLQKSAKTNGDLP